MRAICLAVAFSFPKDAWAAGISLYRPAGKRDAPGRMAFAVTNSPAAAKASPPNTYDTALPATPPQDDEDRFRGPS